MTHQIVMFGGFQYLPNSLGGEIGSDTWTWDGTTWTEQHPAVSPPPTALGSMAFDPAIRRLVLFGGEGVPNDTWAWNGSNWSKLALTAEPSARFNAAMALDPTADDLILAAGAANGGVDLSDTWALDQTWTRLRPSRSAPVVAEAALATDPGTGHLVLFGGGGSGGYSNQTWVWGPLTVSSRPLAPGTVGVRYVASLRATGGRGALHWRVSSGSLPSGLALSDGGQITGTPSTVGTASFTVKVTDSANPARSASRALTLIVQQGAIPGVYVSNGGNSDIHGFALGSHGDAVPVATLSGPLTTLNGPSGLLFDQLGRLFVANGESIQSRCSPLVSTGNVAPVSVLGGSQTDLNSPYGLAFDSAQNLCVADRTANAITVYARGATGNAAPIRTIAGPDTQLSSPEALTVDSGGHLWVANTQTASLTEYPPGASGDIAPMAVSAGSTNPRGWVRTTPATCWPPTPLASQSPHSQTPSPQAAPRHPPLCPEPRRCSTSPSGSTSTPPDGYTSPTSSGV